MHCCRLVKRRVGDADLVHFRHIDPIRVAVGKPSRVGRVRLLTISRMNGRHQAAANVLGRPVPSVFNCTASSSFL